MVSAPSAPISNGTVPVSAALMVDSIVPVAPSHAIRVDLSGWNVIVVASAEYSPPATLQPVSTATLVPSNISVGTRSPTGTSAPSTVADSSVHVGPTRPSPSDDVGSSGSTWAT